MKKGTLALIVIACTGSAAAGSHFASSVVNYTPGTGPTPGFDDPAAALGGPTRFTAPTSPFGGATTPFNAPFGEGEVVTIGEGGSLTLGFDQVIYDDAANPFGIDLLVFGNSFFGLDFGTGLATGAIFGEGGIIELSANGTDWFTVTGVDADGLFPTLGYQDVTEPFPSGAGSVFTDFRTPVDPNLNVAGMTVSEIAAAYNGSGGGAGIDLASVGLTEARYIRISNPLGSGVTPEIDAVSIVPAPAGLIPLLAVSACRRRRSQR